MGRGRRIKVGRREYRYDDLKQQRAEFKTVTRENLAKFANQAGPVQQTLWDNGLIELNWTTDEIDVNPANVQREIQALRKALVQEREYSRDYTHQLAAEQGRARGLTTQQELNAYNREWKARAQAVKVAAEAGNIPLSRMDKRLLTMVENDFMKAAYGSKNQYSAGTLKTKSAGRSKWTDESVKARAREQSERLAEYRGKVGRAAPKDSINPFSRRNAVSNSRAMQLPPTTRLQATAPANLYELPPDLASIQDLEF